MNTISARPGAQRTLRAVASLTLCPMVMLFSFSSCQALEIAGAVAPSITPVPYRTVEMPVSPSRALTAGGNVTTAALGTFDIIITPGVNLMANAPALAAFNRAAAQWEQFIADPITVNIDADLVALPSTTTLGQAGSVILQTDYDSMRNVMVFDAADEADDAIVSFLPTSATAAFDLPVGYGLSGNVAGTKANLKALGFVNLDTQFGSPDGAIEFNSNFPFDYDNTDGVTLGAFDFETVALHEIGHVLGFFSEVDYVDQTLMDMDLPQDVTPITLDLFRFDNNGAGDPSTPAEFNAFSRSLVPGNDEIIDQVLGGSGGDIEVRMSTGVSFGDGRQASHFKDNLMLGVMDPTLAPGEVWTLTANDLRAFDLIGYEITIVPEPAALAMLLAGLGVGGTRSRRHASA